MKSNLNFFKVLMFLFLPFFTLQSQTKVDDLKEINKVWAKFYEAFEFNDFDKFKEIHSKDLIRISGGKRISDFDKYMVRTQERFRKADKEKIKNRISLRFFERVCNGIIANERGIYKLIVIKKDNDKEVHYGQFHALMKKENGKWKIIMDYDSNEGGTIGELQYNNAISINQIEKFSAKN